MQQFYLIVRDTYSNSPELEWWDDNRAQWTKDRARATRYSSKEVRKPIAVGTGRWVGPCDGSET